jgi:hypothetical protein
LDFFLLIPTAPHFCGCGSSSSPTRFLGVFSEQVKTSRVY